MKLYNEKTFENEVKAGEDYYFVECVTNDNEERHLNFLWFSDYKIEILVACDKLNETLKDKRFKYILVKYKVLEDYSLESV